MEILDYDPSSSTAGGAGAALHCLGGRTGGNMVAIGIQPSRLSQNFVHISVVFCSLDFLSVIPLQSSISNWLLVPIALLWQTYGLIIFF